MSLKTDLVIGIRWTTISTVVLAFVSILKLSILARLLDKADFGLVAIVTFVMGFMELFNDMGISTAILHKQEINKNEYASLYWLNIAVSVALYLILLIITSFISVFYDEPQLNVLIPLLGLNLIISGIGRQFRVIEQKELKFKQISIIDIIGAFVSFVVAFILALTGYGVFSLVYSLLLQFLFSNIAFFIIGLKRQGLLFHFKLSETKPFLKIGAYYVGGQIVNYFNRDLDILLIGKFFSSEILGGYNLAKQLVFRPTQIINPIVSKVATPTLSRFQYDTQVLKKGFLSLINIVSSINIPIYLGIIIFAPFIIELMYGSDYNNIAPLVRILSIYMIFRAIGNPVGSLVIATGRTDLEFRWNLVSLIIIPVIVYLGSQFGIVEVTFGITFGVILLYIPSWKILINKMTDISLKEYLISCFKLNWKNIIMIMKRQ